MQGLRRIERGPALAMTAAYTDAIKGVDRQLEPLIAQLAGASREDAEALRFRIALLNSRKASIVEGITTQLRNSPLAEQAATKVNGAVSSAYRFGVQAGIIHLEGVVVSAHRINREFTARTLAKFQADTNARQWVESLAGERAGQVVNTLQRGVLLGQNPREMTRAIAGSLDAGRARVATFVRTEVVGAARQGSLDCFRANADVVTGWVWNAADDCCMACAAMAGTLHELSEEMDSHPNCRCSADPTTAPFADLQAGTVPTDGSEGLTPVDPNDRMAALPEAVQRKVLGPTRFSEFKAGNLNVRDIAARTDHPTWGPGIRAKSLRELGIHPTPKGVPVVQPQPLAPTLPSATDLPLADVIAEARASIGGVLGVDETAWDGLKGAELQETAARALAPHVDATLRVGEAVDREIAKRAGYDVELVRQAQETIRREYDAANALLKTFADEQRAGGMTRERMRELADQQQAHLEAHRVAMDSIAAESDAHRQATIEVLSELREMGFASGDGLPITSGKSGMAGKAVASITDCYPRDWLSRMNDWLSVADRTYVRTAKDAAGNTVERTTTIPGRNGIKLRKAERGQFKYGSRNAEMLISEGYTVGNLPVGASTALHEMGHFAEAAIPALRQLQFAYYRSRTFAAGEYEERQLMMRLRPGHGYSMNETVREDKWSNPYMGKDYGNLPKSNYEVFTMGMERVMATDREWMTGIDDSHRRFILGLLALL